MEKRVAPPGDVEIFLTDAEFAGLGRIVAQWSCLELAMEIAIMALLGTSQPQSRSITAQMNAGKMKDALSALADNGPLSPGTRKRFDGILRRIGILEHKRNRVVHAVWGRDDRDRALMTRLTARGKLKFEKEPFPVEKFDQIAIEIGQASGALYAFLAENRLLRQG